MFCGALGDTRAVAGWKTDVGPDDALIALANQVPLGRSVRSDYDHLIVSNRTGYKGGLTTPGVDHIALRHILLALNADGAPFDQFSARIRSDTGEEALLCMQSKHTDNNANLSLKEITTEYAKISAAMADTRLCEHVSCAGAIPFVVLIHTVKRIAADVTAKSLPLRCFVVGRDQFPDYFGSIFGARAEVAARLAAEHQNALPLYA